MGVLSTEKESVEQALSQEKVNRTNVELFLAQEKEWKVGEPSRVNAALEVARAIMQKEDLDKVVEYAMFFRRSVLFLVTERHPSIDLSEINFASLKGNNVVDLDDGFVVALTS